MQALIYYEYCVPNNDDEELKIEEIYKVCALNISACKLKLKQYDETLNFCNQILNKNPNNLKARFRRAQAYRCKELFNLAKEDIEYILKIGDPNDALISDEYKLIKFMIKNYV